MKLQFLPLTMTEARPWLDEYWQSLSSPIESFLEDHIFAANFYSINCDEKAIGLTAVHAGSSLVLLHFRDSYNHIGQAILAAARRLESIQFALVPTCDEQFLSLILESCRRFELQAYYFQQFGVLPNTVSEEFELIPAGPADAALIRTHTDTYFDPLPERINQGQLFLGKQAGSLVSFGVIEHGRINPGYASIGMFVLPDQRQKGYGTNTLLALQLHCQELNLTPIAGCWYYNHNSKKTLEKTGMFSKTRLLKAFL